MSSIDSPSLAPAPPALRLLDQVRARIRVKHCSIRTEETYVDWIRRFVLHFGKRHPRELGARHVGAILSDLAVTRRVAASTQNQAKAALLFLYREVLELDLPWLEGITQARAPQRLPVVLTSNSRHPQHRKSTRVPEKTAVPTITSGLQEITGFSIPSDYSQLFAWCNFGRVNGKVNGVPRYERKFMPPTPTRHDAERS